MLSKGIIKLVNSLKFKKYRLKHKLFIAEGQKMVSDLVRMDIPIKTIITSNNQIFGNNIEHINCNENELNKISFLKTSPEVIALVNIPQYEFVLDDIIDQLCLVLDGIQDPGNMGTIVRIANWFGIKTILCSEDSADIYNPKVVQATMGALMKVKVHYLNLPETIKNLLKTPDYKVYGTFMEAESIYDSNLSASGLIVMGNEGKGISREVCRLVNNRVSIPSLTKEFTGAESLNVGVATGIVVAEFTRRFSFSKD